MMVIENLSSGYGGDLEILHRICLNIPSGSLTGLVGLNGSGKSTLLKTICGFLKPWRGRILLAGEDITGLPTHRLIKWGLWYIPQSSGLFPYLTV
ncbi:MAG: ATP-binding cassette domain-containing protein, partial [Deltaproteobacteria bacterium]|nr:ATP-binding cassette domain-containing protein [Deltaproteobacteria bacterium]